MTGIYFILNKRNSKCYIGSSLDVKVRLWQHKSKLRSNSHINKHLQNAFNKYGERSFIFQVLDVCKAKELPSLEQAYIDIFQPKYNISNVAEAPMRGLKRTSESVNKSVITKRRNGFYDIHSERMRGNQFAKGNKLTLQQINILQEKRRKKVCVQVKQVTLEGKLIRIFSSIIEAANALNVSKQMIHKCIKNPDKYSCKGYRFLKK